MSDIKRSRLRGRIDRQGKRGAWSLLTDVTVVAMRCSSSRESVGRGWFAVQWSVHAGTSASIRKHQPRQQQDKIRSRQWIVSRCDVAPNTCSEHSRLSVESQLTLRYRRSTSPYSSDFTKFSVHSVYCQFACDAVTTALTNVAKASLIRRRPHRICGGSRPPSSKVAVNSSPTQLVRV